MENDASPRGNVTAGKKKQFLEALVAAGGSLSNAALRRTLDWPEDFYSRVHGRLLEEGKIRPGPGRGGTVWLVEQTALAQPEVAVPVPAVAAQNETQSDKPILPAKERDLYTEDLRKAIENWFRQKGVEGVEVEPTHSRGSKSTGGTFTRPDYTAALRKEYRYVPTTIEVATFEIKPDSDVTVLGVMEALSHRESSHRAFVLYAISEAAFNATKEARRIVELASKYGVGIIVTESPGSLDTWIAIVEEERNNPDPDRLERFLVDLPDGKVREKLAKWKK